MIEVIRSLLHLAPEQKAAPTEAEVQEQQAAAQALQEDAVARAEALTENAKARRKASDLTGAAIYYAEAITLLRNANATVPLAHALRHAADVRSQMRDYGVAGVQIEEALRLYGAFDPPSPNDLANAYRVAALNEERQAHASWMAALDLYRESGIQEGIDECEQHIARLKHRTSSLAEQQETR